MTPDYRLIVVTVPDLRRDLDFLDAARAAEAGGATAFQIRWKAASAGALLRITERLLRAVEPPVYVNDRVDVARAAGADGVHLGANDLDPGRVGAATSGSIRVGFSVGSEGEAAAACTGKAHYWSLGPFNRTRSKADAGPALGEQGFRRLADLAPAGLPVIAIGGIGAGDVRRVVEAGARGVAVISAVSGASDVERATREIRDELDACIR